MLRQVHFSRIDLELHSRYDPAGEESIFECDRRLGRATLPLQPLPEDRFLCAFAHIFAGAHSCCPCMEKFCALLLPTVSCTYGVSCTEVYKPPAQRNDALLLPTASRIVRLR